MTLAGRTAIVTGAGGSLGSAILRAFRAAGARVVAVDADERRLSGAAGSDREVIPIIADVTSPADATRIVGAAGMIDVLVNCAAILGTTGLIDEVSNDEWARVLAVNLTGPFNLCRAAVPLMLQGGGGAIVNIASIVALGRSRANAAYTASKHGLVGLTEHIAFTFGDQGIRCNAICPAGMTPPMSGVPPTARFTAMLEHRKQDRPAPAPVEKVAAVAVFLASDDAAHINGVALRVDSGLLNW